jgi:RimJ/RimL family protein N-acetyltransferase
MDTPSFLETNGFTFQNLKTGDPFRLHKAVEIPIDSESVKEVVAICNEPHVYDFLFRPRLAGAAYSEEMAKEFLSWAAQGWRDRTHYVFLAVTNEGRITAAVDIKSNDLTGAEIGYWASESFPGVATPAVRGLCEIAKDAGFKRLVGLTLPDNERSADVLRRNGFNDLGILERRGKRYLKFERALIEGPR